MTDEERIEKGLKRVPDEERAEFMIRVKSLTDQGKSLGDALMLAVRKKQRQELGGREC